MSHYVKFTYQRARTDIAPFDALAELNAYRRKLLELRSRKIFAMAGHEGGVVTFGENLEDAFDVVMRERRESSPCI